CACPTSSTPSSAARKPASRSRASFSSSTTIVRMAVTSGCGLDRPDRQAQADAGAGAGNAGALGLASGAVEPCQSVAEVPEADASLVDAFQGRAGHAEAVVTHGEGED